MAFPIQKRSQILKDLQLFCEYLCDGQRVIDITMDDLANPQPERTQLIYLFFAEHFFPDCAQRLRQASSMTLENIEFPELQADDRTSMLVVLGCFFQNIGVDDLQVNDIFQPTPKKTQKILGHLVNFMKLVALVDDNEDMQSVVQQQEDLTGECQRLADHISKSEEESSRLWRKRRQDEDFITNLHSQHERELEALEEISAQKDQVLIELSKYDKQCNKVGEHVSSLEQQLEMKENDNNLLENQLIQSPEKLSEQVDQLQNRTTEATEKSKEASDIYTKWQLLSTQTKPVPMTFETIDSTLEASVNRIEKLNSMSQNTERLQANIHEKKRMLRDTITSTESLDRKYSSLDQRAQQTEYKKTHQGKNQCNASSERDMQLLTMEEANVYEKKEKGQKSLRALQNQVENKTQQCDKFSKELEETTENISSMYHNRHKTIVENHENIMKICEE